MAISLCRVLVISPKIFIKLPKIYEKQHCNIVPLASEIFRYSKIDSHNTMLLLYMDFLQCFLGVFHFLVT